jgi:hypothetical protein
MRRRLVVADADVPVGVGRGCVGCGVDLGSLLLSAPAQKPSEAGGTVTAGQIAGLSIGDQTVIDEWQPVPEGFEALIMGTQDGPGWTMGCDSLALRFQRGWP